MQKSAAPEDARLPSSSHCVGLLCSSETIVILIAELRLMPNAISRGTARTIMSGMFCLLRNHTLRAKNARIIVSLARLTMNDAPSDQGTKLNFIGFPKSLTIKI